MKQGSSLLALLLLVLALPVTAEVFTYLDAEGQRVFTDRPQGQASERVPFKATNAMPATPLPAPAAPPVKAGIPSYVRLQILAPAADSAIRDNAGNLAVSVASEPALRPDHRYRLRLDGEIVGETGSNVFQLENLDRGTHLLVAEVIDAQEQSLIQSPPHPVHLLRVSLAQRRLANPCQLNEYGVRPECPLADKPVSKRDIPFVPFL